MRLGHWSVPLLVLSFALFVLVVHLIVSFDGPLIPPPVPAPKRSEPSLPPLSSRFSHTLHRINLPIDSPSLPIPIPDSFIPHWDLTAFNYTGVCSSLFRHPPHSPRDLVVFAHAHSDQLDTQQFYEETNCALHYLRRTLPRARVIAFFFGSPDERLYRFFNAFHVEMYRVSGLETWHGANARVPVVYDFLRTHIDEFDRVVWADTRDIYHFADVFQTFGVDDLIFMAQGLAFDPTTFANEPTAFAWMERYVSRAAAEEFAATKRPLVNIGYGIGGAQHVAALLGDISALLDERWGASWGYEQTILNWAYHTGLFEAHNLTLNHCDQRMCFLGTGQFNLDGNIIRSKETGCSPIVWHKGLPDARLAITFL